MDSQFNNILKPISKHFIKKMVKPIILISGTSGVGKTLLAKTLFNRFNLDHRLTTGMIREVIKTETDEAYLHNLTFNAEDHLDNFLKQSRRIEKATKSCIARCQREGASLVIEGNHLTPELFYNLKVDVYVVLTNKDVNLHKQRILSRGLKRPFNAALFQKIRDIDRYLVEEAKKYAIPVVDNLEIGDTVKKVVKLVT